MLLLFIILFYTWPPYFALSSLSSSSSHFLPRWIFLICPKSLFLTPKDPSHLTPLSYFLNMFQHSYFLNLLCSYTFSNFSTLIFALHFIHSLNVPCFFFLSLELSIQHSHASKPLLSILLSHPLQVEFHTFPQDVLTCLISSLPSLSLSLSPKDPSHLSPLSYFLNML